MRLFARALLVFVCLVTPSILCASEYDDCDADFIAAVGASAYQFSPAHTGDLGTVRLFSILSYQRAAYEGRFGPALWQLRIERVSDGTRVLTVDGRAHIGTEGAALAELWWDGRDDSGQLVPAGRYRYTFVARYFGPRPLRARTYDAAFDGYEEALASSDEVIVNYDLTEVASSGLRISANATSCQVQQNTPLESGFAYNFYYGSTHAHSNWSDGGHPTGACNSGNAYGSGTFAPADVFGYARSTAGLDFWVVNEHNHLIQDAIANNNPPVTETKVRQRYQDGLAAANAATVNGSFVAIYGMEWGVSTNGDQGHVTLLETPALFGWETCSTCNGPSAECTPGTNCYFDVFTPKRYGYLTLYRRSVENPSSAGALGILNHPATGEFDNYAFNADADEAIQGIAVRSGLAFSTAEDCANANVGSTDYCAALEGSAEQRFPRRTGRRSRLALQQLRHGFADAHGLSRAVAEQGRAARRAQGPAFLCVRGSECAARVPDGGRVAGDGRHLQLRGRRVDRGQRLRSRWRVGLHARDLARPDRRRRSARAIRDLLRLLGHAE